MQPNNEITRLVEQMIRDKRLVLTDRQTVCFFLYCRTNGGSHKDVGEALGITRAAAHRHMQKAMAKLDATIAIMSADAREYRRAKQILAAFRGEPTTGGKGKPEHVIPEWLTISQAARACRVDREVIESWIKDPQIALPCDEQKYKGRLMRMVPRDRLPIPALEARKGLRGPLVTADDLVEWHREGSIPVR